MKKTYSLLLLIAIGFSAEAQTATLAPSKDNAIYSENGNSTGAGELYSGRTCASTNRRALMHFDVSSIPSNATITSVTLTVNVTNVSAGGTVNTYNIHALTTAFGEGTSVGGGTGAPAVAPDATWANAMTPATPWTLPGGDYIPTVLSTVDMPVSLGLQTFPTSPNLVAAVQSWLSTPASNFGMIMIGDEATLCTARRFGSKEVGIAPSLVVTYTLPCTGPTAVCQNINVYLDQSGNATITGSDIDGGSTDDCNTGSLNFAASQTTFSCADLPTGGGKLIITGAYDGPLVGGLPKGIELYVDGNIADLSAFGVGSANNGGGTDGQEFTFPAVPATDGTFIYVSADSAGFFNYFGFNADYVSGSMLINGDDAVELFQSGVVIDVFGDINLDGTGTGWDYLDGWAYRNDLIPINNGVWTESDFYYSGINAMDGETTNATAATPFPLASYITSGSDIPVTLVVTDGLMNQDSCTALITVMDTLAPLADAASLSDVTAECSVTSLTAPTATDNCSGATTGTHDATLPITAQGTTVVTWTYVDGQGNTSTQTQNVIITDVTAPVPNTATLSALTDPCQVTPTAPTATDNCEGAITGTTTTTFPITASTTITWTYDDGNGNSSTQDQTVTITGLDVTTTSTLPTITANATGVSYQWYNCTTGSNVAGATSQSYTVTATGDYAVIITSGNCSDTSACVNVNTDGIEELIDLGMSVSPNPSSGKFNVSFDQNVSGTVLVLDANGRIVESIEINNNALTVDLSAFQSGMYIMQVATENGVSRARIVKD